MKNPCLEEAKIVEFRCLSTSQTEKGEELPTMGDKIGYIAACIMLSNFRTSEPWKLKESIQDKKLKPPKLRWELGYGSEIQPRGMASIPSGSLPRKSYRSFKILKSKGGLGLWQKNKTNQK
jgi:hypothetical protein